MKVNNKVEISISSMNSPYDMTRGRGVLRNSNLYSLRFILVLCISFYQAILA